MPSIKFGREGARRDREKYPLLVQVKLFFAKMITSTTPLTETPRCEHVLVRFLPPIEAFIAQVLLGTWNLRSGE